MKKILTVVVLAVLTSITANAAMKCTLTSQSSTLYDEATFQTDPSMGSQIFGEKTVQGLASYKVVLNPSFNQGNIELTDLKSGVSTRSSFNTISTENASVSASLKNATIDLSVRCTY